MSLANASVAETDTAGSTLAGPRTNGKVGRQAATWAVIACALLVAAGAARTVQERRHKSEQGYKESCPIDLAKLPTQLGQWHLIKGGEKHLDELTMRITGGSDHLIRTYANDLTGVFVTVLILFGSAEPVLPHTPQLCYPASGFTEGEAPSARVVEYSPGKKAQFLAASYFKANGRRVIRDAVYHSFRLDGEWSPFIGMGRKFPRRNPGIFKIQIQRIAAEGEALAEGDPIEQFLEIFLPELEAEIKAAPKVPAAG